MELRMRVNTKPGQFCPSNNGSLKLIMNVLLLLVYFVICQIFNFPQVLINKDLI